MQVRCAVVSPARFSTRSWATALAFGWLVHPPSTATAATANAATAVDLRFTNP